MTSFRKYFYETFPHELLGYWREHRAPESDGILTHRGAVVLELGEGEERYLLATAEDRFRFSWYAAAFLDWGLRTCFAERFPEWLQKTGGLSLPRPTRWGRSGDAGSLPHPR